MKVGSDSDSDWSSLERRERDPYSKANRKPTPHKKVRKKRGIPVAPPRLPSFEANSNNFNNKPINSANNVAKLAGDPTHDMFEVPGIESLKFSFVHCYERTIGSNAWLSLPPDPSPTSVPPLKGRANTQSDGSELSNEDNEPVDEGQATGSKTRPKRSFHLRRRAKPPTQSHSIPESNYGDSNSPPISYIENNHSNAPFSASIDLSRKSQSISPYHNRNPSIVTTRRSATASLQTLQTVL